MGTEHSHTIPKTTHEGPLLAALMLTSIFLIAEVIGGIVTGSLALISDAAALAIAFAAIRIGKRPMDTLRTFGYYRRNCHTLY